MEIRCDSNISESELEGERTRALQKLQVGALLIRSSDDGSFRCPFCLGSKTQNYKLHALFQHASSMAASSKKLKEVACHQAVVKFLLADLGLESHQPQVPTCGALGGNEIILRPTYDLRNVCQDNGKMILTLENDKQLGELLGQGFRERNTKCESERRKNEEFNSELVIEQLIQQIEDNEAEIEHLQALNQALILKELRSNEELQAARKELIEGWKELSTQSRRCTVGVKRMGEINPKPFEVACKRRFPLKESEVMAGKLYSLWQDEYLQDSHWHPFKSIKIDGKTDAVKEVIDDEDERLKQLRTLWGNDVCEAVTKALVEMNEYNPSGRYCVDEIWHFKEDRKVALPEAIRYALRRIHCRGKR